MSTHAYCSNLRRAVPPLARRHKVTAARHRAHPLLPVLLFVAPFRHAAKIQNDLRILTERLARINDNLARKITSRNEYDKTIQETEAAYSKVRRRRVAYGSCGREEAWRSRGSWKLCWRRSQRQQHQWHWQ